MATKRIAGSTAWRVAAKGPATRWAHHIERFSADIVDVAHPSKFKIGTDDTFFCLGSCFARNIEEHLIYHGVSVLSRRIVSPKQEWPNRVNGFVNKFTTHSMRNEVDWVIAPPAIDATLFEEQSGGWIDLQLSPHVAPVTLERAIERRAYLTRDYFNRLREASVIVMTLGLNEVWFDRATGRHVNAAPSYHATRRDSDRYELLITDVDDNVVELNQMRRLILSVNPRARIIVTVSPVPLSETFSGRDVLIANMYSKSTLRAAADIFAQSHDDVDYFPSYDIVSMSPRATSYDADCLHVADAVVGRIIQMFLYVYLGASATPPAFNELAYLQANPDVEAALRRGELASGFEHWQRFGRQEGRALGSPDAPQHEPGAGAQPRAAGRPIVNLDDFRTAARSKIGPDLFDYIDGGAGDELTCAANRRDFDAIQLAPLVFRDVAQVDLRWSGPLGQFALPIGLSPSAMQRLVHEHGELATAGAANTVNVPMIVSMMASCALEEIAAHSRHNAVWLQTYVLKDRVLGSELIRRAEQAGFKAIVVSAGCPVMGKRDRNLANGFTLPNTVRAANFHKTDALDHNNPIHSFDGAAPDPGVTWRDLENLIAETELPVVIKGIINAADVAPALASGAAALIVSNHGGRQLDGTMSAIRALPDVVDAVAGRVPVLIDGGIRRGIDVVKALALGADAVLLGRTVMWALAAGGERGVTSALEILADEFANALRLVGCATIAELRANASAVLRRSDACVSSPR
jgi:isopentenyl diphosphate isomerase/L-lactate dehydrogenase-like FMN-dependent dehydrogenase